jgi:hypothetical protein
MITAVSSGEISDHGHSRVNFPGAIGGGDELLSFSTEIAALFVDAGDDESIARADNVTTFSDLSFAQSIANTEACQCFKKLLSALSTCVRAANNSKCFDVSSRAVSGNPMGQ